MDVEIKETTDEQADLFRIKVTTPSGKVIVKNIQKRVRMAGPRRTVDAQIELPLGTGGPDGTPLPPAGQVILRATDTFRSAARVSIAAGAQPTKTDAARPGGGAASEFV